jgi:hypothetical protein
MIGTIRAKVFGSLKPGTIDIFVGYGIGMVDNRNLRTFKINEIPKAYRMPNTYLWITLGNGKLLNIRKMSPLEIEQNKWE